MPLHSFLPLQSCLAAAEAQAPLPLHAFLPSAPWPLHALWPLQTCLSAALASAFFSSSAKALLPASIPAATTPITLVNSLRSISLSLVSSCPYPRYAPPVRFPAHAPRERPYAPLPLPCQGRPKVPGTGAWRPREAANHRAGERTAATPYSR